jgi:beta-lactamase superfamily II metal-dependent hydrolase
MQNLGLGINMTEKIKKYSWSRSTTIVFALFSLFLVLFIALSPRLVSVRKTLFNKKEKINEIIKVTYLYVGQGTATLIRDLRPEGKIMLIDGGPSELAGDAYPAGFKNYMVNAAKEYIIPYLENEEIENIDYIVSSHKDVDHIGGLPYLIRNFKVGKVFDNGTAVSNIYTDDLMAALKENPGIEYEPVQCGMEIPFGDGIACQVIGPLRLYENTDSDENNSSVVIRLAVGALREI